MTKTICEINQEIYEQLLVSIEAGIGILQIFIAVCDNDLQREKIISEYEKDLKPKIKTERAYLDLSEASLRKAVADVVGTNECQVVTVLGAEILGLLNENELKKFFGYLQWTREALREFKIPIILWVPSRIFDVMPRKVPDFWSWRNGVFNFNTFETTNTPLEEMTLRQLRRVASCYGVSRYSRKRKSQLLEGIYEEEYFTFSIKQLEKALADALIRWGEYNINTGVLYSQLGKTYTSRIISRKSNDYYQDYFLAEKYLNKAINLQRKFQKLDSLADTLNDLAGLYYREKRYEEVEFLYIESIGIHRKLFGDQSNSHLIPSLNNLANLYSVEGRWQDAEPLYREVLSIHRHLFGKQLNNDLASSTSNLANLYKSQGNYKEAESLYHESLKIRRYLFSQQPNSSLVNSLNNLADLYELQGRWQEAEALYKEALAIYRNLFGGQPNNDLAASISNLGNLYKLQGRWQESEFLFGEALEIRRHLFSQGLNSSLVNSLNNLADLCKLQGKLQEAEPLYSEALKICRELNSGQSHDEFVNSLYGLANLYKLQGRWQDSDPLFKEALDIQLN
jgi:tetratricopeptide (TPR) repeat protein